MPRSRAAGPIVLFALAAASAAPALVIDNGLAPPNPANLIDTDMPSEPVLVRDQGCAGEPLPCPTPGPPTTVEVNAHIFSFGVTDHSTGIVAGGTLEEGAAVGGQGTLLLQGGVLGTDSSMVRASGQSQLVWTGGGTNEDTGLALIEDTASLFMDGGFTAQLRLTDSAVGTIVDGHVGASAFALGSSQLLIQGGIFAGFGPATVLADDDALMRIQGGFFRGDLVADGDGVIRVLGSGFEVNGIPVGYGLVGATSGTLSGMLADGTPFDMYFEHRGGGEFYQATGSIFLVPEPASGALLAAALAGLAAGRRALRREA